MTDKEMKTIFNSALVVWTMGGRRFDEDVIPILDIIEKYIGKQELRPDDSRRTK